MSHDTKLMLFICALIIGVFILVINKTSEYDNYLESFKKKCEENQGFVYVPNGAKGFPDALCLKKESVISIYEDYREYGRNH